jgi:hypothetical protein
MGVGRRADFRAVTLGVVERLAAVIGAPVGVWSLPRSMDARGGASCNYR